MKPSANMSRREPPLVWREAVSATLRARLAKGVPAAALLLLAHGLLQAQSRLEQSETTYQANLKPLHMPVLQDYLNRLESLKSDFTLRNRTADAAKVDGEIGRVKSLLHPLHFSGRWRARA